MKTVTLHGETSVEIGIAARQASEGENWEVVVVTVHAPKLPGADPYTGEIILSVADGQAIWAALPEAVQDALLARCAEEAYVEDDEDPPSREEIADERTVDDWARHSE